MTLFEYLAIAFSLLFSFSAMRLVGGLPHAVQSQRRYWVHLSFVCFQLLTTVIIFWLFWTFRTVAWNFPIFLLVLASPCLIYFNACTLIPENPSAVDSWHDYYYSIRRRFFIGVCCWVLAVATISTIVLKMPVLHVGRAAQAVLLAASVAGAVSAKERIHSGLALFVGLLFLFVVVVLTFRPGSFAPP